MAFTESTRSQVQRTSGLIGPFAWAAGVLWMLATATLAADVSASRQTIVLDGVWQVAQGGLEAAPKEFTHTIVVPGLLDMAQPAFTEVGVKSAQREAFWYRRSFQIAGPLPAVAIVKIHKAMFGARVIVNGTLLGDHLPNFTPGYFDARAALHPGENEILVRVGAFLDAVPPSLTDGRDFEKKLYIPGIYDSVELILSGTPYIVNVQAAPDIATQTVRVQTVLRNVGETTAATLHFLVREAKSGKIVGTAQSAALHVPAGAEKTMIQPIPLAECHLWSPEDPFLYELLVDSGGDRVVTRFGMREFRFDPATGRALLNGKPYFMRGSNVCIFRFMEDSERKDLPWREDWVRKLHRRFKDVHWNCLRYCIGFPPESWYRIADEEGLLIQDEFPIWYAFNDWKKRPPQQTRNELAGEYTEWMQERWNHPCVVIWDAQNETESTETGAALERVRSRDLSNRPWDNGWSAPVAPTDSYEAHPYHFYNPQYKLQDLATAAISPDAIVVGNSTKANGHAIIVNEYGWLWLNRDGTPTTITAEVYKNLLGPDSTTAQRRHLYARYMAAETEFWRAHRRCAAVLHFCGLGYSRPDGQTSDHWTDVAQLTWEPEFYAYVRDAFAPVGLMIDAWTEKYPPGQSQEFPVIVSNDLYDAWKGTVRFRLIGNGQTLDEKTQLCEVAPLGSQRLVFALALPEQPGPYRVEAALVAPGAEPVRSLRDFEILTEKRGSPEGASP